jgi:prolyl oligopeptidase
MRSLGLALLGGALLSAGVAAAAPPAARIALDLARPELKNARTVVPEPASGVLLDFHLSRDALYAEVREGFTVRLLRHAGTTPADVAPMLAGSAFAVDDAAHAYRDVYFATSAWTEPSRILRATARGMASRARST